MYAETESPVSCSGIPQGDCLCRVPTVNDSSTAGVPPLVPTSVDASMTSMAIDTGLGQIQPCPGQATPPENDSDVCTTIEDAADVCTTIEDAAGTVLVGSATTGDHATNRGSTHAPPATGTADTVSIARNRCRKTLRTRSSGVNRRYYNFKVERRNTSDAEKGTGVVDGSPTRLVISRQQSRDGGMNNEVSNRKRKQLRKCSRGLSKDCGTTKNTVSARTSLGSVDDEVSETVANKVSITESIAHTSKDVDEVCPNSSNERGSEHADEGAIAPQGANMPASTHTLVAPLAQPNTTVGKASTDSGGSVEVEQGGSSVACVACDVESTAQAHVMDPSNVVAGVDDAASLRRSANAPNDNVTGSNVDGHGPAIVTKCTQRDRSRSDATPDSEPLGGSSDGAVGTASRDHVASRSIDTAVAYDNGGCSTIPRAVANDNGGCSTIPRRVANDNGGCSTIPRRVASIADYVTRSWRANDATGLDSDFQVFLDANLTKKYGDKEHMAAVVIQRAWHRLRMARRFGSVAQISRENVGEVSRVDRRVSMEMKKRNSQMISVFAQEGLGVQLAKHDDEVLQTVVYLFNLSPQSGIRYALRKSVIPSYSAKTVAEYLNKEERLSKRQIGNYLSKNDEFCGNVRLHFMESLEFEDKSVLMGLREVMDRFHLTGESAQVQRTLETFAFLYHKANPNVFKSSDAALVLAYSMLMLNTDAYDENVKNKMTEAQFIRNNRGIDGLADPDIEMQKEVFKQIKEEEIKTPVSKELQKCMDVVSRITESKHHLAPPHRVFVKEISVTVITDVLKRTSAGPMRPRGRRTVFIFNDVMIITKPEKSTLSRTMGMRGRWSDNYDGKYTMVMMIPLVGCKAYKVGTQLHEDALMINYHAETGAKTITLKVYKGIERDDLFALIEDLSGFVDKVEQVRMEQKNMEKKSLSKSLGQQSCRADSMTALPRRVTLDVNAIDFQYGRKTEKKTGTVPGLSQSEDRDMSSRP